MLAITCKNPEGDAHLISQCSHPLTELSPESSCSFQCEAGYELQGAPTIQCSEEGQWNKDIPTCKGMEVLFCKHKPQVTALFISLHFYVSFEFSDILSSTYFFSAIECPAPEIPSSVHMSCSPSPSSSDSAVSFHPLGVVCSFSCDEGHELQGTFSMECVNPGQFGRKCTAEFRYTACHSLKEDRFQKK